MRYLSSISLALVVLMVLACTEQSPHGWTPLPENTISPASSATYVPRYTDSQVIGFIQKHLNATEKCSAYAAFRYLTSHPTYLRDKSAIRNTGPQEQYYVTFSYDGKPAFTRPIVITWTFFGDSAQVLPTSAGFASTRYRFC